MAPSDPKPPASERDLPLLEPGLYRRAPARTEAARPELPAGAPEPAALLVARQVVAAHHPRTPFERSVALARRYRRAVFVKYENCAPIRSFKARGALASVAALGPEQRAQGVVTVSTGNHGQGVAFAGQRFGVAVTVVVPVGAEPVKVRAIEDLGARVVAAGANLTEATRAALGLAEREGLTFVEDGEDPGLMAGAATVLWEMLEDEPRLDAVVVPVGGGNLIASALLAAGLLKPSLQVIGVQSAAAPGATLSWLRGALASAPSRTAAGGLATERPGALALGVMLARLDLMALVSEDDLWRGVRLGFDACGYAIEPSAAAGLAALERFGANLPGERVGLILTGGRIGAADLCRALAEPPAPAR